MAHAQALPPARSGARRGRATLLLAALLALASIAVAALILRAPAREDAGAAKGARAAASQGEPAPAGQPARTPAIPSPASGQDGAPSRAGVELPAESAPPGMEPTRFDGTARVEGFLILPSGVPPPERWTLVLAPPRVLIGGERAVGRRVEFEHGETTFSLTGVPLGGYELRAEAARMSGATEYLLLARPDALHAIVHVTLAPAAFVTGRVVDAQGAGVAGLEVLLEPRSGAQPLRATTGSSGAYLFELVPDGEYRLLAADLHAPIAPARELVVGPPSLHVPELQVPLLSTLALQVVDAGGPVAGARLEGWGSQGGRISAVTDAGGLAQARFLPPGRYAVRASAPEGAPERSALIRIELPRIGNEALVLVLE